MSKIKHYISRFGVLIKDLRIFLSGVKEFQKTGNTPVNAYMSMIALFCQTSGVSSYIFHKILSLTRPKVAMPKEIQSIIGTYDKKKIKQIASKIEEDGYHIFDQRLPEEYIDKLLHYSLTTPAYVRPMDMEGYEKPMVKDIYKRGFPNVIRYDLLESGTILNETVQKIMADKLFFYVAQEYFKCRPSIDVTGMWWHTDYLKEPNAEAATMYHFDMDRIKWLKFFIYLTDVEYENGPHCFIKGSHKPFAIPKSIRRQGYARITDEEIFQNYKKEDEVVYIAPKGTIIAEDTIGFHKGLHVLKGDRLIFQIQYSDSLFGGTYADERFSEIKSPELKVAIDSYPKVFERYLPSVK